ncbi:Nephrin [Sarcoptes scabiei]|uniref:Nephrin n=2 Tax=Sarcoptes scabiei TaxID=52283 RepID=A0A834RH50_SARSC|nr:Nephrin [Sarcoptes scabiei]
MPPTIDDHVVLILWYKDDELEPIYTIDARKDPLEKARVIASANLLDRAYFNQHNQPAFLQIDPVRTSDAGEYRCRVDFKKARTVNIVIQLKVIGLIGPFNEGDRLVLVCASFGGKPRPTLTWWKDYSIIDDSFEYKNKDVTINELVIESLARHHLLSIFTCQSTNNNITIASSASITIDLNLKPIEVKIKQMTTPLLANSEAKFECSSFGSKPKARVYWIFNDVRYDTELQGDMQTLSILNLQLKREHNGQTLSCFAENSKISNSTILENFVLNVEYQPDLTLQLGSSTILLNSIQEGNDIYFDCILDANPMPTQPIVWRFNDEILESKPGIIQSNYSLVLQNIRRQMSGKYQCQASNQHGTTISNSTELKIRFAPYCKFKSTLAYGLSLFESSALVCEVESNPKPNSFMWEFEKEIHLKSFRSENYSSILNYRPNSTQHYGTIECIAKNDVGLQQIPCKYHIIDSGPPGFPFFCKLHNQSVDKISILCTSEKAILTIDRHHQQENADRERFEQDRSDPSFTSFKSENKIRKDSYPYLHHPTHQDSSQSSMRSSPFTETIFVYPPTYYIAEVYDKNGYLLQNLTFNSSMLLNNATTNRTKNGDNLSSLNAFNFKINSLTESSIYKIKIYAINSKGTSDHLWINAQTLRRAEKYVYSNSSETGLFFSSYSINNLKTTIASLCGLLILVLVIIIVSVTYLSRMCHKFLNKKKRRLKKSSTIDQSMIKQDSNFDVDMSEIICNEINDYDALETATSAQNNHLNEFNSGILNENQIQTNRRVSSTNDSNEYAIDNLAIPTVYTETNVICNEFYGNMLATYNNQKESKSKMQLLSLDLYNMNPMNPATIMEKGPPDLIPTFYYNNQNDGTIHNLAKDSH